MELEELQNIGKVTAELLRKAGIHTIEELIKLGSKEAFMRMLIIDPTLCINMLYALEGAIQGVKDYSLDEKTKQNLKDFYRHL